VTRSEVALLLGAATARDRRTVGETDVLAWHEDLGDLDFADAREAVSRHYRQSTDWIMPGHIRQLVRVIRDERRAASAVKALPPGPFEDDPERDERIRRNAARVRQALAQLAARRSIPAEPVPAETPAEPTASDLIRQRALDRARADRRGARG
jgi:uncharacterized protein (DUF58 family)